MKITAFLYTLAFTLAIASGASAQENDENASPSLADRFHIANKPYSELRDRWGWSERRAYDRAISKFPVFAACRKNGTSTAMPALNWAVIREQEQAEICLFLLAEYLGPPEALVAWLKGIGFSATLRGKGGTWTSGRPGTVFSGYQLNARDELYIRGFRFRLARRYGRRISISVKFDAKGIAKSANVNIKWE
ncbi:hypothetical protein MNBD_ALPHA07-2125 [hydrothermal vent metagenome]|uniref:Uncharacterized protein n=1 Tax=hydrothermal vent metagenome TaxID=652676 RepID=A0A3B0SGZ9_9ZZZZ